MTEADWRACRDPLKMLAFFGGKVSERQLRLFACACCREALAFFADERASRAVGVAERLADRAATDAEVADAAAGVEVMLYEATQDGAAAYTDYFQEADLGEECPTFEVEAPGRRRHENLTDDGDAGFRLWEASIVAAATALVADAVSHVLSPAPTWREAVEAARSATRQIGRPIDVRLHRLLRDILGDPFRRDPFEPAWRTVTVTSLAQSVYESRAFDRLPILADALEDAGCTAAALLDHCRGPVPHYRGCWVVDLVLGKE